MDRIIFGDNQFFGVSHMSEDRGMERMRRFQDTAEIIKVIDAAYDCGIHAFTFSTHDRVAQICDHFRANPRRYADLRLYPVLPYAQKYAHLVNEKGVVGAISDVLLADNSVSNVFGMLLRGSMALLTQDPIKVMTILVDAEMKMFRELSLGAVFLQNNLADLVLGLGIEEVFAAFTQHIETRYNTRAGFMTLNMPQMAEFLKGAAVQRPLICAAINKVGFQMNPDIATYEKTLRSNSIDAMAMSVMAAGAVPPREAFEYVAKVGGVASIIFGASTRSHIEHTQHVLSDVGWC
ncbi:MAG: hypothetical protein NTU53_22745 [Planctomycetota bacterium]|nr:hypothetical protein [Planctomycetota bacterium]